MTPVPAGGHWAAGYIGQPWTPDEHHCWALCCKVWADHFGWVIPPATFEPGDARATRRALSADPEYHGWQPVVAAAEGDAVLMAMGVRPCHVGVWIKADPAAGILHSVERSGVIFTAPHRLHTLGYRIIGLYRRAA